MTEAKNPPAKPAGRQARPRASVARSASRLGAVQALYQMDIGGSELADVLADYGSGRLGVEFDDGQCGEADYGFLKAIVEGVVEDQVLIDTKINECLGQGWTLARLEATSRAILRAGGFELMFREDVPPKVTISEYVEVAKAFFSGSEPGFINASLDALARKRRAEEL
ncbi:MAG: transcription antitermination factor NusB [Pseudomonadota bacterium]